jgi:hypothetical protein
LTHAAGDASPPRSGVPYGSARSRSPGSGSRATVVTALDLSPYRSSADTLLLGSLALDALMLACTYAPTRPAVGRALRPVRTMTDQATGGRPAPAPAPSPHRARPRCCRYCAR